MPGHVLRAPLHEGADGGRRGVQDIRLVALDDRPPAVLVGKVRRALVNDSRGAIGQRPKNDVAVAGDPADVGGAPVNGIRLDVEDVVVSCRYADQVASGGVNDPLRLGRRTARIQKVQKVL